MLEGIRKASQGGVGKVVVAVLMGLLVVSFGLVFNISDMLHGVSSDDVAKVGSFSISRQALAEAVQRETQRLQSQIRQPLTPQLARQLGIDARALDHLIDEAALNARAREMGLAISEDAVAQAVRDDPSLKGIDGGFDRDRFNMYLRNTGQTEGSFFRSQSELDLRQQLQYALVGGIVAPKPLAEALLATRNETREIAYFTLPAPSDVAAPSADVLKAFFESRKADWRAPERRSFDLLAVTPASLAKPDEVSDAAARAQYDKDRETKYVTPETRRLQQIVFDTQAQADEAAAKLKDGMTFDDLAKSRKLTPADLDLGESAKSGVYDPAVAEAAFALPEGGVSAPVKGPYGYVLVRVVAVKPQTVKSFDEVKSAIKLALATASAASQVEALHGKIEDAKASGKTVAQAAESVGLTPRAVVALDRDGRDAAGAPVDLPAEDRLLPAVFASDIGLDDDAIATKDHGYVWFAVTKIDPAHDQSFDDVKDKVAAAWIDEERARRLADSAAEAVKKLEAGADLADIAKAAGVEVKTAKDVRRSGGASLPREVAPAVFDVGPNGAGAAKVEGGRLVFKVTADTFPPVVEGDPARAAMADQLKGEMSGALLEEYVKALRREIGVTIDPRATRGPEGG